MSEKRPGDGVSGDAALPALKRGRWESNPAAPGAPAPLAPPLALTPAAAAAASAAAAAAAVAAKYAQPPGAATVAGGGAATAAGGAAAAHLSPAAAAAVAAAAAAAMQKLPLAGATAGIGARPAALPLSSLGALEKAKKALQLQKEIQEKLKAKVPQLAAKLALKDGSPAGAAAAAPALVPSGMLTPGLRPPLSGFAPRPPAPLLAMRSGAATPGPAAMMAAGIASMLPPPPAPPPPEENDPFYDPALARGGPGGAGGPSGRKGRRKAGFDFVSEGRFQREAELFRMKAQLGPAAFRKGDPRVSGPLGAPARVGLPGLGGAAAAMDANLVPLGKREPPPKEASPQPEAEPVPAVEWWDRGLLQHASLDQDVPELPAEVVAAVDAALAPSAASGPTANGHAAAAEGDMDTDGGGGAANGADGDADMGVSEDEDGGEGGSRRREQRRRAAAGRAAADTAAAAAAAAAARAAVAAAASRAAGEAGGFHLREARLTLYVEHPVPLEPPAEAPPPPPQPLKLTAKELKKLRTQRRLARDKERQELIRQGLLEPPAPKVRIANLHRVLGTDAAADPTAIEKEVRKQMAERQAAHEDRNLARKLTPAERRDKKLRKLFGTAAVESGAADVGAPRAAGGVKGAAAREAEAAAAAAGVECICSVFRVGRLSDPQHRFKVDANARENHMTGMAVISDDFCVVVVEGVEKATRRYLKLMLRRIDWSAAPALALGRGGGAGGAMGMDEDEEGEEEEPPSNTCTLVWQGSVLRRSFKGFRLETVRSAAAGRQLLADHGAGHYWDAAAAAEEGQSVPYSF